MEVARTLDQDDFPFAIPAGTKYDAISVVNHSTDDDCVLTLNDGTNDHPIKCGQAVRTHFNVYKDIRSLAVVSGTDFQVQFMVK